MIFPRRFLRVKAFSSPGLRIKLIFFSAILSGTLSAQNYFFDTYSVSDDLAQSTVFTMLQDRNDYLWLGTRAGLSRFDGKKFMNFTMEDGLAENGVKILCLDSSRRLWIGHAAGGVSLYDGHHFRVFSKPGAMFSSDITSIVQEPDGAIWITSELSGAVKITKVGMTLEDSEKEQYIGNTLSDRIFGACSGHDGKLYFITDAFIKIYNPSTNDFSGFQIDGMPRFFQITLMFEDSRNNLWFGTYHGGLYKYDIAAGTFRVFDNRDGLGSNWISALNEDGDGNIWVGTWGGGLTRIGPEGIKTYDKSNGLPDLMVRCILGDREGNLLIGTNEHGINIFKGEQFVSWFRDDGLTNPQVWSIMQADDGRFWFGTNDGISIFDPRKKGLAAFSSFYKLKDSRIRMLKEDKKGRIWIASGNQDVFTFNTNNGQFTYEPGLNSYLSTLVVTSMATDTSGRVWTGTLDGLVGYDYDTRKAWYFTQTSGLAGNEITAIYTAPNGELWVGSRGEGLSRMEADSFRALPLNEDFTPTCMVYDGAGRLWVGTEAKGVVVVDSEAGKIVEEYKESDGLLANLINLIESDKQGNIYIGTNKGLNIYHQQKKKIYSYTDKNGFVGIETKPNSVCRDNDGYLWFGTVSGVTRFDPYTPVKRNGNPLTHIISFKVNLEDRVMNSGLKLNFFENDVILDYISICLTNPDAVRYQIMLDGADNDWRPVTEQTTVTYPSLAPGRYTFRVKALNSEGNWNEKPVTYSFQIRPPFYKSWWFILICIFTGAWGIILYVMIRERNLLREKRILEDKVMIRTVEVVAQKEELAQKNKDITDSIRYAKRIQFAILPPKIPFKDTFILFRPKDIVSGDFYWIDTVGDREYMAAVDCTGHGVPGALMSIIGHNSLNKVVHGKGILDPAGILDCLNEEVIFNLRAQDEDGTIYDGMDVALVCYNRAKREIEFAGAYNPLVIIRNGEIIEIKADRFSIGRSSSLEPDKKFTGHRIKIEKGDVIYLFSDGYGDQFGGEHGKKFKAGPMKELFRTLNGTPMDGQRKVLENTLESWRGNTEQIDDILIIGRRF